MSAAGNKITGALIISTLLALWGPSPIPVSHAAEPTAAPAMKARWYRYYQNGVPMLSSVITQEHVRYGYDALNSNMMVLRHVPPFTQESYDRQKTQRDQLEARRLADRNLVLANVSAANAAAKRDQVLAEMISRSQYLSTQMADIQTELGRDVAAAAGYERRQASVPKAVQTRLQEKRIQIEQMQRNISALQQRQDEVKSSYARIIARLDYLEHNRAATTPPHPAP